MNALTLNHLAFTLGMRINLHRFFQLASILITLLAAGLLCYGVNELIEYLKYSGHS
ncbi:FTR1 family protein [Candidatus Bathyarchaeota archaeon]|nr:FTR1 family protein [Candidatus Bathyarchaeota archaeon]